MEIPRYWRTKAQRLRLEGEICENGHPVFPPRDICSNCGDEAKKPFTFSGKGEVYSFTTIQKEENAPAGFEGQVPYTVALIKLEEGPIITAQLTDIETEETPSMSKLEQEKGWPEVLIPSTKKEPKVEIGMRVEMVTRKLKEDGNSHTGQIIYGYKFRPISSSSK